MTTRPLRPVPARPAGRPPMRPGAAPPPAGAVRKPARPIEPPAVPSPDVAPPLIASPEETDSGSVPVIAHAKSHVPPGAAKSKNLQNLEELLSESKAALQERDAALAKIATLEDALADANRRLDALKDADEKATELQGQLQTAAAERDRNAEALAETQRQVEELAAFRTQSVELQQKLDAVSRTRAKLAQDHAKMKARLTTFEGQQKELIERLKSSEVGRRKAETALANAKEERNEYKYRIQAVLAVAQGEAVPPRPKGEEKGREENA